MTSWGFLLSQIAKHLSEDQLVPLLHLSAEKFRSASKITPNFSLEDSYTRWADTMHEIAKTEKTRSGKRREKEGK
jgi:hypothetical protein